jgi:hypothetical protein
MEIDSVVRRGDGRTVRLEHGARQAVLQVIQCDFTSFTRRRDHHLMGLVNPHHNLG